MTEALRFLLFVGLGIAAFIVFILGAEPFEVPGQNPIGERIGGSLAVALYCAACQFWFARRDVRSATSSWPAILAMALGLAVIALFVVAVEGGQQWRYFAVPVLMAGALGRLSAWPSGVGLASAVPSNSG